MDSNICVAYFFAFGLLKGVMYLVAMHDSLVKDNRDNREYISLRWAQLTVSLQTDDSVRRWRPPEN